MLAQTNNTQATTFQNAALSHFSYGVDSTKLTNDTVNAAPPGFVTLKIYGNPAQTNAQTIIVGKVDPTSGIITSFETVTRGTRFSDYNGNSLEDLKSDAAILAGSANDPFVTGMQGIAAQIARVYAPETNSLTEVAGLSGFAGVKLHQ